MNTSLLVVLWLAGFGLGVTVGVAIQRRRTMRALRDFEQTKP